jgi:hypothetical protein
MNPIEIRATAGYNKAGWTCSTRYLNTPNDPTISSDPEPRLAALPPLASNITETTQAVIVNTCNKLSFNVFVNEKPLLINDSKRQTPQTTASIMFANKLEKTAIYETKNIEDDRKKPFLFRLLRSRYL